MSAGIETHSVSDRRLLWWMFGYLRPVKRQVAAACLFLALGTAAEILTVRQTAEAVNRIGLVRQAQIESGDGLWAWLGGDSDEAVALRQAVLLLAALTCTVGGLTYLRETANMKLGMHKVFHMRAAVYDQLQRVGLRFHDRLSTGELINRSFTDLQNVRSFISSAVLNTLEITLIAGGYILLLLTRAPLAAVLALAPIPAWIVYILRFSRKVRPAQAGVMEIGDKNVSLLTENLAGVHVVKAFATQDHEVERYAGNCDEFLRRVLARIRLYANFAPVMRSISMISHLSLFFLAGVLIIRGRLHPGDILMLGSAMGAILGRLQQVAAINEQYQNAMVSARRLYEVLSAEATTPLDPQARALPPGPGAVQFENVTFGYDPACPVLHNLSFAVRGKQMVALVGPTGAGKTTLVQLLARLYDPQQGRILVDGVDVRTLTLESLRGQIAFVFQETYLFSDSVEANIAYGRPHIRGDILEAASRLAAAHEFIDDLPRGYGTILGERGATLSGGQRQRLAIARAIFSNPRILILDDATASVDPETEQHIHRGVRFVMDDATLFVIAHRLNTVQKADVVIVLEGGHITQMGTHVELLRQDGYYRNVAALQLSTEEDNAAARDASHLHRVQDPQQVQSARAAAETPEEPRREEAP